MLKKSVTLPTEMTNKPPEMKISVIIPVYNGAKYIAQCIEMMLCQTYKDLEIIVVDDGSSDNSAKIAEKYPVKIIRFANNQGLSAARNAGITAATGEYIHFMDVDDFINLEYYERMVEAITLTAAEVACSCFINEIHRHASTLFSSRLLLMAPEDKVLATNAGRVGSVCNYLYKKTFLKEKNLQFEVGRLHEDAMFSLEAVYETNKLVAVPDATYYYKKRSDSIVNRQDSEFVKKRKEDSQRATSLINEFLKKHNLTFASIVVEDTFKYKFLGIPIARKVVFSNKRVRWYLLGINFLRRA
ncbi:MAG: glycosyltransferase [Dysgonamonadaceae bacterium]|jgi:glycosyltransferase involved in cell wall biosynthesis|nr:glycosyltransferase [Dysgonamonadaceae bacterium]